MTLDNLKNPFPEKDVEWRVQQCGMTKTGGVYCMVLAYITARAVQDRLDDVVGVDNWRVEYQHSSGGVMCGLSIKLGDEWVTKWDGSPESNMEAFKGGISGAFKRAAVVWGVGRYLYGLDTTFANTSNEKQPGWNRGKTKEGKIFYWQTPTLPSWALPKNSQ